MERKTDYSFALVDFVDYEGWEDHLNLWKNQLKLSNCAWKRYKGSLGEFPNQDELDCLQGIVIPGSKYSANDNWNEACAFIRKVVERGRPQLFCGCFGSQLLAVALGGTVDTNPSKRFCCKSEILKVLPGWYSHPVLACARNGSNVLPKEVRVLETHGECVIHLPLNATLAASSETLVNEAWYIGNHVLAMQSHPEFTPEIMEERIIPKLVEKNLLSENDVLFAHSSFCNILDSSLICDLIRQFLCFKQSTNDE